ncbi:MAG: cell division protein DivIVA [Actinomycetota bacterium]|uniref:Cell division protein DivIVA n=1 Tax=Mycobacterium lentiflavum TaxID=141349 RepID=A0ABY3UX56_MYCLN|nr:cell division protein DivIVA [Mycobacterium lentiflavum]MEE3067360.1 cell division protein DivIVA [Actinomycetota bacterium]ULP44165.1 cell division protein DivIVA [Mycobacterium lentiflavum]
MITEPAMAFGRKFMGYDAAAVDAHIEMLTTKQNLLHNDVESLRARLRDSGEEAAALRKEVAALTDTSPAPHAMQQRMAKMLSRAVEEISEMQAEARAEAAALIAAAEAEIEAEQRKHREVLADLAAQQKAMEAEYRETRKTLEAELASMRDDAQKAREQLLADAKERVERDREQARRAVNAACDQRIKVLEQLMGVYRDLETVPAALEAAYHEQKNPPKADAAASADEKVSAG